VIPVLGGKEGVGHIALACLDPGETCLAPDPGYPPYTSGPLFAGATVHYLPLREENGFLPELERAPQARLLYLNYPNNPTGATAELDFFEQAVDFARERDLVVVHDNAYSEVAFDGYRPPSFLEAPGAKEVGVEIFSLSKGWNMTGWRAALVAGNPEIVEAYRRLKTNLDSGMSEAVQHAAAVALTVARAFPREISEVYARRRDLLAEGLAAIGLEFKAPRATPYFWVRVPEGHTSASFTELVLEQASVLVSPGDAYGPSGEGYVRLSLTVPDSRLEEAVGRITEALVIIQS
jgi:LL-diaminopimelate aminotransferase